MEKKLKKQIKNDTEEIHIETKKIIENLEDSQVMELLDDKWIVPLTKSLYQLPDKLVGEFTTELEKLSAKYEDTLEQVEEEIRNTENELSGMLDMLTGNEFDMQGISEFKKMLQGV